ncbi:MAG TPA: hypothetical protein PKD49_15360 [Hyphomicrobium sp.]|nr:hypothetical protein [Hyphomicrobium sp.]
MLQAAAPSLACFYSAALAWNHSAVDSVATIQRGELIYMAEGDFKKKLATRTVVIGKDKDGNTMLLPGDIVALDSVDTVADPEREDLATGTGLPPTEFGVKVAEMARRWNIHQLEVVADDARGLENDTVVDLLNKNEGNRSRRE